MIKTSWDWAKLSVAQTGTETLFYFIKVCCIKWIQLFKLCKLSGGTLLIIPSKSDRKLLGYGQKYHS